MKSEMVILLNYASDIVDELLISLIPGFILYTTVIRFSPIARGDNQTNIMRFLVCTIIIFSVTSWWLPDLMDSYIGYPLILIVPFILGVLGGLILRNEWVEKIFGLVNINIIHSIAYGAAKLPLRRCV